jgi:CheY-like chemotaxis protein
MNADHWILMVDDDEDDQFIIKTALEDCQYSGAHSIASTATEAWKILQDCSLFVPDFILLDLNMPKIDGREFLARIMEDPIFQDIPVIIYSTSSYQLDIDDSKRLGASAYWVKPLRYEDIVKVIGELLLRNWKDTEFMLIR